MTILCIRRLRRMRWCPGKETGGASSGCGEGAERAAGHEGAWSGRREFEGGDAESG